MDKISVVGRKSYPEGQIRDYGPYGQYKKINGRWERLKKGYPQFRRTIQFKNIKDFLLMKGIQEEFIESNNTRALRSYMREHKLFHLFVRWSKNNA